MSKIKDGGPAFPMYTGNPENWVSGLSLRDYFAASAPEPSEQEINILEWEDSGQGYSPKRKPVERSRNERIAALRYAYADAMIAEREK
jgi:hypothetical protein